MRYAANTTVPVEKSKADIEKTITRHGADAYYSAMDRLSASIGFRIDGRMIKIDIPLPNKDDFQSDAKYEQAIKQRWRALLLIIKAKFELIEDGMGSLEEEFMPWLLMPNGKTFGEWASPQIEAMYKSGKMPPLLPMGGKR